MMKIYRYIIPNRAAFVKSGYSPEFTHFSKPKARFVREFTYEIQDSGDTKLSSIVRAIAGGAYWSKTATCNKTF